MFCVQNLEPSSIKSHWKQSENSSFRTSSNFNSDNQADTDMIIHEMVWASQKRRRRSSLALSGPAGMKHLFIQHFGNYVPEHSRKVKDYCLPMEGRHYKPMTIV